MPAVSFVAEVDPLELFFCRLPSMEASDTYAKSVRILVYRFLNNIAIQSVVQ